MLKKISFIFLLIFISLNFILGFLGFSSVLLTISFYALLWLVFIKLLVLIKFDKERQINFKVFITSLFFFLFIAELFFKYGLKTHLSYNEQNGSFFYTSPYKEIAADNFYRKYILKYNDAQLRVRKPNSIYHSKKTEFDYAHTINSIGIRGAEPKLDSNLYTIIGLGDSFTEGVGAADDSTWLRLVENEINLRSPSEKVQCINGGLSGSDPFYEYILIKRQLIRYKPKLVIVAINQSDINDVVIRGGMERFTADGLVKYKKAPWWEFFYQFSYIFRGVMHSLFKIEMHLMTEQQFKIESESALVQIRQFIENDFVDLSVKENFRLIVLLHPFESELEDNRFSLQPLWDSFIKNTSFTTIDLFTEIRERKRKGGFKYKELYWPMDHHHNPKGYALWSDILAKRLIEIKSGGN